jgi:hypothetical protein
LDAAAAEAGDLGEGVNLAAAVAGLQRGAGVEAELLGGEAPGGGAALGQELGDELREGGGSVLVQVPGPMAALKVTGTQSSSTWTCLVALAAEAPTAGTRTSSTPRPATVARRASAEPGSDQAGRV